MWALSAVWEGASVMTPNWRHRHKAGGRAGFRNRPPADGSAEYDLYQLIGNKRRKLYRFCGSYPPGKRGKRRRSRRSTWVT
jgi:hypothetical protein